MMYMCVYVYLYTHTYTVHIYKMSPGLPNGWGHWLSIDLPFTPLVGELLKIISPAVQAEELFHSVYMHMVISLQVCVFLYMSVCVSVCVHAWAVVDVRTRATTYSRFYSHSAPS